MYADLDTHSAVDRPILLWSHRLNKSRSLAAVGEINSYSPINTAIEYRPLAGDGNCAAIAAWNCKRGIFATGAVARLLRREC